MKDFAVAMMHEIFQNSIIKLMSNKYVSFNKSHNLIWVVITQYDE